jgi:hypothetical protein
MADLADALERLRSMNFRRRDEGVDSLLEERSPRRYLRSCDQFAALSTENREVGE